MGAVQGYKGILYNTKRADDNYRARRVVGEAEGDLAVMSSDGAVRGYRESDFTALMRLRNASAALAADGQYLDVEALRDSLERPGQRPEENLFVAEVAGGVIGYVGVNVELALGRAVVSGYVEPEQRRRGFGGALYRRAVKRARRAGAGAVHVNVNERDEETGAVLEGHGFTVIRRFVEMEVDVSALADDMPPRYPIRGMRDGEAARLADIQNRSFDGSWGFSPNSAEEIAHKTSNPEARDDIWLAMDGERTAGYCWMGTERSGENDQPRGRVTMIGVDADYRGQGVGRDLLRAGLAHARDHGLGTVRLTVDGENRTAHNLYVSMGFVDGESGLWYEKSLV